MPSDKTASGTNSPPLEATGQEEPMGVTGASGAKPKAVPDSEQRQQYFEGAETGKQRPDQKKATTD
ncbi:hypothetical protein FOMPIDRAFT_1054446 [Fomitopsis schrenkii]|uniref:Uncharacterized protein n=1 Tax=Fomitopsis schrenkii TaxID=2126942 RepID=S8EZU0_FOMSC|nr:hypothetical protein FOMPIDRAFT_1054446 [Fomitopsis schrenkii]